MWSPAPLAASLLLTACHADLFVRLDGETGGDTGETDEPRDTDWGGEWAVRRIPGIAGYAPTVSADGERIAFVDRTRGLVVARPDGTNDVVIVPIVDGPISDPTFSPDRSRIAYRCTNGVCVTRADGGSEPVVVSGDTTQTSGPFSFSPDGMLVAFSALPDPCGPRCWTRSYVADATGAAPPVLISPFEENSYFPTFTPDGERLILLGPGQGAYGLWLVDPDGSDPAQIYDGAIFASAAIGPFDFTADGGTVYFPGFEDAICDTGESCPPDREAYAMPIAGGTPKNLTRTPEIEEYGLYLSPDGRLALLPWHHERGGDFGAGVLVLDTATLATTPVLSGAFASLAEQPWLPDGSAFLFSDGASIFVASRPESE